MRLAFVCHWNDRALLDRHLARAMQAAGGDLVALSGYDRMTRAYAVAESRTPADVCVFVHQDVAFPPTWPADCLARLAELPEDWAVAGVFGTRLQARQTGLPIGQPSYMMEQTYWGNVRDTFEHRHVPCPGGWQPVETIDGLCIIKRRVDPDLAWDVDLPGFHGYADDLCYQAHAAHRGVYALDLYTEHWCDHTDLDRDLGYQAAKRYVTAKWRARRPLPLCTTTGLWA